VILHLLHRNVPAIYRVALSAIRTHLTAVDVRMAIRAILPHVREHGLCVAFKAFHLFVHPSEGIICIVVVEFRIRFDRAPPCRRVAIFARDGQRRAVRIARNCFISSLGRLRSLRGRRTTCGCASQQWNAQQSPQSDAKDSYRNYHHFATEPGDC
jgi:hypothetical protein